MAGFGDRLREARVAAGLTQEQLGFAVGVTNSAVSAWENGRDVPSFSLLPAIHQAVHVSLDTLVLGARQNVGNVFAVKEPAPYTYPIATPAPYTHAVGTTPRIESARELSLLKMFRALQSKQQQGLLDLLRRGGSQE